MATTGAATSWDPNVTGSGDVRVCSLAVSGSTVYVGGQFTAIGGQTRNNIAALDAGTGLATAWNPNASGRARRDHVVDALAVSGSTVYAGGEFSSIGGQTRNYIAALDCEHRPRHGLGPQRRQRPRLGSGPSPSRVRPSTPAADFTSIGGQTRNNIAALDASTGLPPRPGTPTRTARLTPSPSRARPSTPAAASPPSAARPATTSPLSMPAPASPRTGTPSARQLRLRPRRLGLDRLRRRGLHLHRRADLQPHRRPGWRQQQRRHELESRRGRPGRRPRRLGLDRLRRRGLHLDRRTGHGKAWRASRFCPAVR